MRSFSDEFRLGTYEILRTKPISSWHLVTGKYAAILAVVLIALIPTLVYCYCIQQLAAQNGLDSGATLGSYIGLFFLSAVFSAIGVWCSSFTNNAVVSFLAAALACLLIYSGFAAISRLPALASGGDYFLEMMGIDFHFRSISRGVVDSRDIVYFLSVIYFFLFLCKRNLDKR